MTTHFYAFGSICRGEIDRSSDIDLLACVSSPSEDIDPETFSVYRHDRLRQLWRHGNPFAWHLHLESRLLFSSDGQDFIASLGLPSKYVNGPADCAQFARLFAESRSELLRTLNSATFNLSCMFLATRNFATCYSLHVGKPCFSRNSPLIVDVPLAVQKTVFDVLSRARVLSTRGLGSTLSPTDISTVLSAAPIVSDWMSSLLSEVRP
ncbi:hypothetical protein [Methylibium sp.]|uniref:hypothetical protein n=1 Tax=Methylibium sp. TaxID=2067992 RepID=UPI00345B9F82